jgi:hypothetical protein
MSPIFNLSKGWSFERQFLLLRGFSYLIAWISLCIVAFSASVKLEHGQGLTTAIAFSSKWAV